MASVVIENPILNGPFAEPSRHFRFGDHGITDEITIGRRVSSYFIPIAKPKKTGKGKGKQLALDEGWIADRVEENVFINQVRNRVKLWREGGYKHVTKTTARLLEHWNSTDRSRRLFFCQIEALETAVYVLEVAKKLGDAWIENDLQKFNQAANPLLDRIALKMATGSGKTVVMAMLIAWQALNKQANPQDARYSDSFLIVTPGITIRDRLRVLLPNDPNDYYRGLDIVPSHQLDQLQQAKIVLTNYHAFQLRERVAAGKLTKQILIKDGSSPFPDFIACIDDGHGPDDLLNLILEVTGERKKDKAAKVSTASTLWIPAVNNEGSFGRWEFLEISDPWDAVGPIKSVISQGAPTSD